MQSSQSSDPTHPKGRSIVVVLYSQISQWTLKKKVHKKQEACIQVLHFMLNVKNMVLKKLQTHLILLSETLINTVMYF